MSAQPRLKNGQFITRECPVCGCGTLQQENRDTWRCDGLRDPNDENKPLEACEYSLYAGEIYGMQPNS